MKKIFTKYNFYVAETCSNKQIVGDFRFDQNALVILHSQQIIESYQFPVMYISGTLRTHCPGIKTNVQGVFLVTWDYAIRVYKGRWFLICDMASCFIKANKFKTP
jgi:hypothetical protein